MVYFSLILAGINVFLYFSVFNNFFDYFQTGNHAEIAEKLSSMTKVVIALHLAAHFLLQKKFSEKSPIPWFLPLVLGPILAFATLILL